MISHLLPYGRCFALTSFSRRGQWPGSSRSNSSSRSNRLNGAERLTSLNVLNLLEEGLPPIIDRHGFLIVAADDAPVAVGFAADYDRVNFFGFKHTDHLIGGSLELRGIGFFSESGSRINVILDELVVPVLAGRHQGVFVNPSDELFLSIESPSVDELPRRDRVEQESPRAVRIHAAEHVAHFFAPILLSHSQS